MFKKKNQKKMGSINEGLRNLSISPLDRYPDYKSLSGTEKVGIDYSIETVNLGSSISIMAPHGGRIEPKTCLIAKKIAADRFNSYCFIGTKKENNRHLHITSHRFDEPRALSMAAVSQVIVTIHACKDEEQIVFIGGRHQDMCERIICELDSAGIFCSETERYRGRHPDNLCNRGALKKGVQLEISRGIRDDIQAVDLLCKVVSRAMWAYNLIEETPEDRIRPQAG